MFVIQENKRCSCCTSQDIRCVCRLQEKICVYPADVVLFEGILVFYTQEVRDMFHMKLFVDTDSDVRLSRRGKQPVHLDYLMHVNMFSSISCAYVVCSS